MMRSNDMTSPTDISSAPGTTSGTATSHSPGSEPMELNIEQGDLAFAVGRALGSVSTKSPLPLLSCVLLEADKNGLRVTGTDLDVTTSVLAPCTVTTPGRAAVSARHFNDVIRKMPKGALATLGKDGVIIPSRAFQAVSRTAEEATSAVDLEIAAAKNQAAFSAQVGEHRVQIMTRLLEGPYPNYEQVIPRNNPRRVTAR